MATKYYSQGHPERHLSTVVLSKTLISNLASLSSLKLKVRLVVLFVVASSLVKTTTPADSTAILYFLAKDSQQIATSTFHLWATFYRNGLLLLIDFLVNCVQGVSLLNGPNMRRC